MRTLTTYERKVGKLHGDIIMLRRELGKDRRRLTLRRILEGLKEVLTMLAVIVPLVALWVVVMDQLLKAKGL